MSSSSYWCHSCHNLVRIPPSPSLSCPSCGCEFVESVSAESGLLVVSGNPSLSSLPGYANSGFRDLSSFGNGRSASPARGFFRRLFRGSRSSRQASENTPSVLLQMLEAASLLQRSRNAEIRNERAEGNNDGESTNIEDVSGTLAANREERSSITRFNPDESVDSGIGRPRDDMLSPRPLDIFLQRLLSAVLQSERSGSLPASKAAIAAMPTFKISKQSLESGEGGDCVESFNECAVCKEAFEIGGEVREMPCKHVYHSNCILPWLELHSSCPLCRREMPVDAEERPSTSSRLDGTMGGTAGEPTLVFIGISGGDALLFSFIFLGSGSRNEPNITANNDGEPSRHVSSVAEEVVVSEQDNDRGETMVEETAGSSSDTPGADLESLHVDRRNMSEIDNIEQITEQRNSLGMADEVLQGSVAQADRNLQSEIPSGKESRHVQETSGTSVREDVAGPSGSSNGMDNWGERRLQQLMTESQEGPPGGGRSRSFFSWFFRHAAARHMSTSGSSSEDNASNANPTIESGRDLDKNVP